MEASVWTVLTLIRASVRPSTAVPSARLHPLLVTCTSRARLVSSMTASMESASNRSTLQPTTSASVPKATQVRRIYLPRASRYFIEEIIVFRND